MKNKLFWVFPLLLAAGAGSSVYLYYTRTGVDIEPVPVAAAPVAAPAEEPAPKIRYPLPEPKSAASAVATAEPAPVPEPLPALDDSDPTLSQALSGLLGESGLALFRPDNIVRRLAVSADNIPREQVPPQYLPIRPLTGSLVVTGQGDPEGRRYHLSADNYPRYAGHVQLLEGLDAQAWAANYVRLYPLFQRAFTELGYPDDYFNDRLVEVIDSLLATPEVEQPVELVRRSVTYRFADPALEALPAGQKMLIRMGPDNAARVKAKLRELREALMARVESAGA